MIATSLNSNGNYLFNFPFVLGQPYHITIQQTKVDTKYWYKIIMNEEEIINIENENAQNFSNVRFYTSDSFHDSFTNQFGSVCNFKILQGGGEF